MHMLAEGVLDWKGVQDSSVVEEKRMVSTCLVTFLPRGAQPLSKQAPQQVWPTKKEVLEKSCSSGLYPLAVAVSASVA